LRLLDEFHDSRHCFGNGRFDRSTQTFAEVESFTLDADNDEPSRCLIDRACESKDGDEAQAVRARLTGSRLGVECGAREVLHVNFDRLQCAHRRARVDGVDHDDQIRSVPLSQEIEWVAQRSDEVRRRYLGNRALSDECADTVVVAILAPEPATTTLAVLVSIMTFPP